MAAHISREKRSAHFLSEVLIFFPLPLSREEEKGREKKKKSEDPVAGIADGKASWKCRHNSREM